jgi:hypothetical protein
MINIGFNTPFDEQITFFRQKLNLPTERWDDIMRAAHDRSFVVAGAMKADLLADLNTAVGTAIADGKSIGWFRDNFKAIVKKHGWTGWTGEGTPAGEAWRTKVIYQTNLSTSYAAGRYAQLNDPELLKVRPYWRYKHADGVANPRLQHVAWNGLTLPHDHLFWQTHFPPNGWGCHCSVQAVSKREYVKAQAAGLDSPPEGWDAIDEKTGAPRGIAKGFDYAPGASLSDEIGRFVERKAIDLPKSIAKVLQDDVARLSKPVFAEAPTVKAAAEWAVKNNLADFADYSGIKPEVANAWNRSLFDHLQEFPELRANQKFVGTCQAQFSRWREIEIDRYITRLRAQNKHLPDDFDFRLHAERHIGSRKVGGSTWAHSWANGDVSGISVNKKWGSALDEFKASLLRNVDTKYHPIGCDSIRSVVDHELGHQIDDLLRLHLDAAVIAAYKEARALGITEKVSAYANKNIKEFIAECWAESLNNASPRAFATRIAGIIRQRYSDKFGAV